MSREIIRTTDAPKSRLHTVKQSRRPAWCLFGTGPYDHRAQLRAARFKNNSTVPEEHFRHPWRRGTSLSKVVSATVILLEESDFTGMNEEWVKWFPVDPPARQACKTAGPYSWHEGFNCRNRRGLTRVQPTRRYGPSTWRASVAAGRLTWSC